MNRIKLLSDQELAPVTIINSDGISPFFFTCEHAGNRIPKSLGSLGLTTEQLNQHIAWDIGIRKVTEYLSDKFNATAVLQNYSRLVVDCNRDPSFDSFIVRKSEYTKVPGNCDLSENEKDARCSEIYSPFQEEIRRLLDQREKDKRNTILIAMHSFTPVFKDVPRPWHIGFLYNRDSRMAKNLIQIFQEQANLCVGDNQPYFVSDDGDYTIPVHGEKRGIPHVLIEIRNDLIAEEVGQLEWGEKLSDAFTKIMKIFGT